MSKMPKLPTNKKNSVMLTITLAVGILFFLILVARFTAKRPARVAPPQRAPLEKWRAEKEELIDVIKKPPQEEVPRHPAARLPLRLVGIFEAGTEKTAYIENLITLQTGHYRIGDKVMDATLIQILSSQVVLLKDGQRIVLTLGGLHDAFGEKGWISEISKDNFVVSRERLNEKARDINDLLAEAIPIPYVKDGQIRGFTVSSLKPKGVINEAGFREGDIVKVINGNKIDSIKKPLEIYQELRGLVDKEEDPKIEIEFERNSKSRTFTYRILK